MAKRYQKNRYGSIITPKGDTITKKQQSEYIKAVDNANKLRKRLINEYWNKVDKNSPNMRGITKQTFEKMLQEKGFIATKQSKSFHQFKSSKDFKREMHDTKILGKRKFFENNTKELRRRLIRQSKINFGSDGNKVRQILRKLNDEELSMFYMFAPKDLLGEIFGSPDNEKPIDERMEEALSNIEIVFRNNIDGSVGFDAKMNRVNEMMLRNK